MLVITRKVGEEFWIGEALVKIVSISGSRVRIGIEAPREIRVQRVDREQGSVRVIGPEGTDRKVEGGQ